MAVGAGGGGYASGGWVPTRKWIAALLSGLVSIAAHAVASGGWDNAEWAEVLTLASGLIVAYFVGNTPQPTGTGVPAR